MGAYLMACTSIVHLTRIHFMDVYIRSSTPQTVIFELQNTVFTLRDKDLYRPLQVILTGI
jgi:hypothetical protein